MFELLQNGKVDTSGNEVLPPIHCEIVSRKDLSKEDAVRAYMVLLEQAEEHLNKCKDVCKVVFSEILKVEYGQRYRLILSIDLDDDGRIMFEGRTYCFYEPDLELDRTFATLDELYTCLLSIQELDDYKLPVGWLRKQLAEIIERDKSEEIPVRDYYFGGNQDISITIMVL